MIYFVKKEALKSARRPRAFYTSPGLYCWKICSREEIAIFPRAKENEKCLSCVVVRFRRGYNSGLLKHNVPCTVAVADFQVCSANVRIILSF